MTERNENTYGMIYQIDPKEEICGYQFVVCTESSDWGIQGYLLLDHPDEETFVRYKGRAYVRKRWEVLVQVGKVKWIIDTDIHQKTK